MYPWPDVRSVGSVEPEGYLVGTSRSRPGRRGRYPITDRHDHHQFDEAAAWVRNLRRMRGSVTNPAPRHRAVLWRSKVDRGRPADVSCRFGRALGVLQGLIARTDSGPKRRSSPMFLATTTVEDFDRFIEIFSTKGAEKRAQHGSKGSTVFRDPVEEDRVWVLFDWDAAGWQDFVSDPDVPAILQEAGHKSKPQMAELGGTTTPSTTPPDEATNEERNHGSKGKRRDHAARIRRLQRRRFGDAQRDLRRRRCLAPAGAEPFRRRLREPGGDPRLLRPVGAGDRRDLPG